MPREVKEEGEKGGIDAVFPGCRCCNSRKTWGDLLAPTALPVKAIVESGERDQEKR